MANRKYKLGGEPGELRLAPFMRLLKAVHSLQEPETMTTEDLEKQRRSQESCCIFPVPFSFTHPSSSQNCHVFV